MPRAGFHEKDVPRAAWGQCLEGITREMPTLAVKTRTQQPPHILVTRSNILLLFGELHLLIDTD